MKGGLLDTCDTWDTCVILIKTFIFTKLLFLVKDKSYYVKVTLSTQFFYIYR